MKASIAVPLPELHAAINGLGMEEWVRFMRRAQKMALIEWRDHTTAPGLAARFTEGAEGFYGFTPRGLAYRKSKGWKPDFVCSGKLRDMMKTRTPVSPRAGNSEVVTHLPFGGGALNLLSNVKRTKVTRNHAMGTVKVGGYQRTSKTGESVSVKGYMVQRSLTTISKATSYSDYSEQFARFSQDAPWIAARVSVHFLEIVRQAAFDSKGKLRSKYHQEVDAIGGITPSQVFPPVIPSHGGPHG